MPTTFRNCAAQQAKTTAVDSVAAPLTAWQRTRKERVLEVPTGAFTCSSKASKGGRRWRSWQRVSVAADAEGKGLSRSVHLQQQPSDDREHASQDLAVGETVILLAPHLHPY